MIRGGLILVLSALMAGCHKDDVEIGTLDTNAFDADYPGDPRLFTIDSVRTVPYWGGGSLRDQKVYIHVLSERFPQPTDYQVWFIEEQPGQDTTVAYSAGQDDDHFEHRKFNVQIGTEYCWKVELHVSDITRSDQVCAVAQE